MERPAAGDRINNYLLDEQIGAGSFGEVWRAHHHVFNEVVAIKIPTDPQYVRNLRQEGVTVHGLRHPNIVRAIDIDPYADQPYLVMEYVDGPSLRQILDAHPDGIPVPAAVTALDGVLQALAAAHTAGIVHRDIKPANILVAGGNDLSALTPERVKVADFGLGHAGGTTTASILQSGSLTTQDGRSIAGTIAYMSPEQREGRPIDGRSDLYACGIVLFEMLTGDRPAGTDLPSHVRWSVPAWLDEIYGRLYTRYERRFANAGEALAALREADAGSRPVGVPVPGGTKRIRTVAGVVCAACGELAAEDDQFCTQCGAQLVDAVPRCPDCDAYVHRADHYCILCGRSLRAHPV